MLLSVTNIYLIRHGESKANEINVFLGHGDLDLTQKGYLQAQKTADFLKDIPADVIYSSDLQRAYHTAQCTAKCKNMQVITNPNLREIFAGEWEFKSFEDLITYFKEDFLLWVSNIGRAGCTGGETVLQLQKRFVDEVEKLATENEGKTIFIFTHATPIRVLKAAWDQKAVDEIKEIPWASNASVTHAQCVDGVFSVVEYSLDHFMGDMVTALPDNV